MARCEQEVLDELPAPVLLCFCSIGIDMIVVSIVLGSNVLSSLEDGERNDHPLAAVVEVRVLSCDSGFLVETGICHSNIAVGLVEKLSRSCESGVTKVLSAGSPVLHEGQSLDPSFLIHTTAVLCESSTELLDHRNEVDERIGISEVETSSGDDVAVSENDLLGNFNHLFPCLGVVFLGIQTCIAEDLLVDEDTPVGQLERETVEITVHVDSVDHAVCIVCAHVCCILESDDLIVDRSDKPFLDVLMCVLDRQVPDCRAVSGCIGGLDALAQRLSCKTGNFDCYIRMESLELLEVSVLENVAACILVCPEYDCYGSILVERCLLDLFFLSALGENGSHEEKNQKHCDKYFLHFFLLFSV